MTKTKQPTFPRPLSLVDVVIFTVINQALHVLLVKRNKDEHEPFPEHWALVGGFVDVDQDDDLLSVALRKLKEKTNVSSPYLEQLGSWGSRTRDPRGWSATHVYFALISSETEQLKTGGNADEVKWIKVIDNGVNENLAFDHTEILESALIRLRNKVEYTSLPAYLLPKKFTISELQHTYEIILGRNLEKSAFRTRTLSSGLVQEVEGYKLGSNRPAKLYKIKDPSHPVYFARTFKPK